MQPLQNVVETAFFASLAAFPANCLNADANGDKRILHGMEKCLVLD
jgi:hypothetical protein